jgi:hypothetical protein
MTQILLSGLVHQNHTDKALLLHFACKYISICREYLTESQV